MSKVSRRKLNPTDHQHYVENLTATFAMAKTKEEISQLFKDLFTHTEVTMLAKRLEVARRLIKENTYEDIIEEMAVTDRTIASVSNTLANEGRGLRTAHERLVKSEDEKWKSKGRKPKSLF